MERRRRGHLVQPPLSAQVHNAQPVAEPHGKVSEVHPKLVWLGRLVLAEAHTQAAVDEGHVLLEGCLQQRRAPRRLLA